MGRFVQERSECRDSGNQGVDAVEPASSNAPPERCISWFESLHTKEKSRNSENCFCFFGPSVEIRTRGLLNPIQARYQTSPHPDLAAQATVICYHSQHKKSSPNFMKLPKISTPNQFCAVIVEECCKSSVFSP